MIEFEYKLPSMYITGYENPNGTYNNQELGFPSVLTTKDSRLGMFIKRLRNCINCERTLVFVGGKFMMCNKNWIRDHVHTLKAMCHWEYEIANYINFTIDTQREDGQFYELVKQKDDTIWDRVREDCYVEYPDDNLVITRLELEADVEYLVVEGAMYVYRITGNDEWLKSVLPALEKGINYMTSDEKRWDKEHGLVKRPFTIDTWDFINEPTLVAYNRRIDPDSPMSIMHGDNSGVYQAMNQLSWFNRRLGNEAKAAEWEKRAKILKENMFKHLWNGDFFIHQLHLNHDGADDKENIRLSLSNTYDINRGVTNLEESGKIIEEYRRRKDTAGYFAEWYTIDPPYELFCGRTPGVYVNGAISPFTAGELAKAAFNNGYEAYGWDILSRFIELTERDGTTYFLYDTDSKPQPDGGPSAWGAAALLHAVDEGLAGIVNNGVNYDEMIFAPRFTVTDYTELRYFTGYELSGAMVDVRFVIKAEGMRYDLYSPANKISAHILLPEGKECKKLLINDNETDFISVKVKNSAYVDFEIADNKGRNLKFEILF